jgi:hypothetical protein
MTALEYLDQQIKLLIPTADGISIKDWDDKETWRVDAKTADPVALASVQAILATFDKAAFDVANPPPKSVVERLTDLEARLAKLETGKGV